MRGNARAVSDGSYKHNHGTSAFVLHGDKRKKAIRGCNTIPGNPSEQCAYQSKLGGVEGIVTFVEHLCDHDDITSRKIVIGLNGESIIEKLRSPNPCHPKTSQYDMLMDCKKRIKALPIKVEL